MCLEVKYGLKLLNMKMKSEISDNSLYEIEYKIHGLITKNEYI